MGLVIQTVGGAANNPAAAFTAITPSSGDSIAAANFTPTSPAFLDHIIRAGATKGAVRLLSPRLHDNVTGITFYTDLAVSRMLFPMETGQPIFPGDVYQLEVTGGSAEHDVALITMFYGDLPGGAANLMQWADIAGKIVNIKALTVAIVNNATPGIWTDTVITATENQLHADSNYALLGYSSDTAIAAVGFKGPETANYRIAGPGTDFTEDTSNYFVDQAQLRGRPYIPVFSGNNRASEYVSTMDSAVSTAANITLILAELSS